MTVTATVSKKYVNSNPASLAKKQSSVCGVADGGRPVFFRMEILNLELVAEAGIERVKWYVVAEMRGGFIK
jgi:hypothetical protein